MKDNSHGEMNVITPKIEVILTGIKSIYLNPYHYTYVIQKEDNYIYLYDEMTMEIVGRSKVPFNETFKTFMFTDNFNMFCTYIETKQNSSQQSQIIVFTLQPQGLIGHYRYMLTRNQIPQNLTLSSIDFYESILEKESFIIGVSSSKIHYINFKGEITKQIDIIHNGRQLNLINAFIIKQKKWIFVEENKIYFVSITDGYRIDDYLDINAKINSIFRGSIRGKFMTFITDLHTIVILSQKHQKWEIRYRYKIPNLNLRKLSFFYPGVSTSTTNKFKDKLFLLIYGNPASFYQQKSKDSSYFPEYHEQQKKIQKFLIPNDLLKDHYLYVHQFSIEELNNNYKSQRSLLKNSFCLKNIGIIKYTIWANQHSENCIRIFNNDNNIISVDLVPLLQECFAGREWVCLGYRFQAKAANILYEETQDNFENQKKVGTYCSTLVRKIEHGDVNDWSYSLFSKQSVVGRKMKRLNCLQF